MTFTFAILAAFAIYGGDDRRELNDPVNPPRMRAAADAVGIILPRTRIAPVAGDPTLRAVPRTSVRERYNLCSGESFADEPAPGYCSGFLVAPDLMVTAGHCIRSSSDCANAAVVFSFAAGPGYPDPTRVKASDVYTCRRVEAQKIDDITGADYAVIRLDRAATSRKPLLLRPSGALSTGDGITVIGYPSGMPLKITGGGNVRSAAASAYFVMNSDTFSGNSGSPVLNTATGLVEGVVVRGEDDYQTTAAGCNVPRRCTESGCRGEDATRTAEFRDAIPPRGPSLSVAKVESGSETAGNGNGIPEPGETVALKLQVKNDGTEDLPATHLALTPVTGGVEVIGTANIGPLPRGSAEDVKGFSLRLGRGISCLEPVELELQALPDDQRQNAPGMRLVRLPLGKAHPIEVSEEGPLPIPDDDPEGATATVTSVDAPFGRAVLITVDIVHPNPDQLNVTVIAPDGRAVVLHHFGFAPDGSLQPVARGGLTGVYGTTLEPYESLAPLALTTGRGTWQLRVSDQGPGLTGEIKRFGVTILDRQCTSG